MQILYKNCKIENMAAQLKQELHLHDNKRLGLLSSIDGAQIIALLLNTGTGSAELWQAEIDGNSYPSMTLALPQLHWFERGIFDLFGLYPHGHPRLKPLVLHQQYLPDFHPLRSNALSQEAYLRPDRNFEFLKVQGGGIYELPVGPIHAGIIEPGHFRFSCFGENIVNLEIQLGWLHRGVEKSLTEIPWKKARFMAEAAASDTTAASALAHAVCIESLLSFQAPAKAEYLRAIALEIERLAMHIIDLAGLAGDIGMHSCAASLSRLRGKALSMAELLSGSRFLRAFILPGGVRKADAKSINEINSSIAPLKKELAFLSDYFLSVQAVRDRLEGIGKISRTLALDFGLVGVAARASGIDYDSRNYFKQGVFPELAPQSALESGGDIYSRAKIRAREIMSSLDSIETLISAIPEGSHFQSPGQELRADSAAFAVVEAFRGELIHLVLTGPDSKIKRYAIKDPSYNNWTAISIAVRNNLIADFPLCNKSLGLSYSGNDL